MPHSNKVCSAPSIVPAFILGAGVGAAMGVALHHFAVGAVIGLAVTVVFHLARRSQKP